MNAMQTLAVFTKRFLDRLFELPDDNDSRVGVKGIRLLEIIFECGLLDAFPEKLDFAARWVFSDDKKIRAAAALSHGANV